MKSTKKTESITKYIDTTIHPGDDFYSYVNSKWIKKTKIPKDKVRFGTFDQLREKSISDIKNIILELIDKKRVVAGSHEQRIRDLYLLGMDIKRRNKEGFTPIQSLLESIDSISSNDDIVLLLSNLHSKGVPALWDIEVETDLKHNTNYITYIGQSGLHLPDRDYYIKKTKDMLAIQDAYKKYIIQILELTGITKKDATLMSNQIFRFETRLARAMMSQVELRDYEKQYNVYSSKKRAESFPNIPWQIYMEAIGISKKERVIILQPEYLKLVDSLFSNKVTPDMRAYLVWCIISSAVPFTKIQASQLSFEFYGKMLTGQEKQSPLWKRSVAVVENTLGEALGYIYVKKHFSAASKKHIENIVKHLTKIYEKKIKLLDWMSAPTKKKAIEKLHSFESLLGYPDKWRKYKGLHVDTNKSYLENIYSIATYEHKRNVKRLGKKVDRKEWHMTPQTVNAYCSLDRNLIVFPAAILQWPFFDVHQEDAANYGAIGSVIGHEITHGFDDKGSLFDKKGDMKNWWRSTDAKKFTEKTRVVAHQFNKLSLYGQKVNGELTLGENIADLGGISIAYEAFMETLSDKQKKSKKEGFTPAQRFFIGYARAWREIAREEHVKKMLIIDPHSPERFRTNIPFSNMQEFYDAFDVAPGDKLYRSLEKRAKIW